MPLSCAFLTFLVASGHVLVTNMAEKTFAEAAPGGEHNEKNPPIYEEATKYETDQGGRRGSVAVNVVENPLKVS